MIVCIYVFPYECFSFFSFFFLASVRMRARIPFASSIYAKSESINPFIRISHICFDETAVLNF